MFTGIIEQLAKVANLEQAGSNLHLTFNAPFTNELEIDQSIAHNGVCLTVVEIHKDTYTVTAIKETLSKTNLGHLKKGDFVNLERCLKLNDRLDGHIVQGHVDLTARCTQIKEENGSWMFFFEYDPEKGNITVTKGSVCVNGVSLTVVNSEKGLFSVAIIPYTFEHTNFHTLKAGDYVNIEFDIIGKYIAKLIENK
ncbi:MAG: riboflavin synthase [Bacteroidetes bacterium]|nr:riboflavin synthase [Bacteroidota bacterium]HET6242961.1 riboflavin synthase [Bacteroidia bacterium]